MKSLFLTSTIDRCAMPPMGLGCVLPRHMGGKYHTDHCGGQGRYIASTIASCKVSAGRTVIDFALSSPPPLPGRLGQIFFVNC